MIRASVRDEAWWPAFERWCDSGRELTMGTWQHEFEHEIAVDSYVADAAEAFGVK